MNNRRGFSSIGRTRTCKTERPFFKEGKAGWDVGWWRAGGISAAAFYIIEANNQVAVECVLQLLLLLLLPYV